MLRSISDEGPEGEDTTSRSRQWSRRHVVLEPLSVSFMRSLVLEVDVRSRYTNDRLAERDSIAKVTPMASPGHKNCWTNGIGQVHTWLIGSIYFINGPYSQSTSHPSQRQKDM